MEEAEARISFVDVIIAAAGIDQNELLGN